MLGLRRNRPVPRCAICGELQPDFRGVELERWFLTGYRRGGQRPGVFVCLPCAGSGTMIEVLEQVIDSVPGDR